MNVTYYLIFELSETRENKKQTLLTNPTGLYEHL